MAWKTNQNYSFIKNGAAVPEYDTSPTGGSIMVWWLQIHNKLNEEEEEGFIMPPSHFQPKLHWKSMNKL